MERVESAAMIPEDLLKDIVCPVCLGELRLKNTGLHCERCRKTYPVRDEIPVLLEGEAFFEEF